MKTQSDSNTLPRLHGLALALARVAWLLTAALIIGILVTGVPLAFALFQTPCARAECLIMQNIRLTPQGFSLLQARGIPASFFAAWHVGLDVVFASISIAIAALIFWRRSDDRMALFVSFTLLVFGGTTLSSSSRVLAVINPTWRLPEMLLEMIGIICLSIFLCVFPNGRFVPHWMRWVAVAFAAANAFLVFTSVSDPPLFSDQDWLLVLLLLIALLINLVLFVLVTVAQVYRYRRVSNSRERQQTKWVVFGFVVGLGGFVAVGVPSITLTFATNDPLAKMIGNAAAYGFVLLVPLSIGVAILRSRLYDIDFIIRRTLVYGALTAILAVVYFVCLFVLQDLILGLTGQTAGLPGQMSDALIIISSASALAIAALSRPLRQRIQDFIDRRFYRRKYDAAKVIAAFGGSLRDEVDLDRLTSQLVSVAEETMQPEHASLSMVGAPASMAPAPATPATSSDARPSASAPTAAITIAPDDPLAAYFRASPNTVELSEVRLDSPALRAFRAAKVKVATPIVSQGELIGVLNLGAHRSQQDYARDDRELLDALAAQAAPTVQVARLVREQRAEQERRARVDQEMQLARQIQHSLLPKELPALEGWKLDAFYQPAREVGGDFYDFIPLSDGRLGIAIGDVTDKGMPAALLMATTRTRLQATAQATDSPGEVLARVNALVWRDIPARMFITCLYAILNPDTGDLSYANAGHDLPFCWHSDTATELFARGMPLGLMPDSSYEEKVTTVSWGEGVLFYTDGVVEAHNPKREMFGFPRLKALLGERPEHASVNQFVCGQLAAFTGAGWEQEDDITMVTLQREEAASSDKRLTPFDELLAPQLPAVH